METKNASAVVNGGRKRLSLDVFKEKSIGNENLTATGGQAATTLICVSIVVSIIITLSSDSANCCSSDDCHS